MSLTTQTLLVVVLFVVAIACLPWLVRWLQRRMPSAGLATLGPPGKLVGALAVGPQQRVVTVEVGPAGARTWLVLGVTAQSITCLHSMRVDGQDFGLALAQASAQGTVNAPAVAAAAGPVGHATQPAPVSGVARDAHV